MTKTFLRFNLRIGSLPLVIVQEIDPNEIPNAGRVHDGGYETVEGFVELFEVEEEEPEKSGE